MQFAKAPESDRVKTRMAPELSLAERRALHCQMIDTLLHQLAGRPEFAVELWAASESAWLAGRAALAGIRLHQQGGGDLGERLACALVSGLDRYQRVAVIGSDCPALGSDYVIRAMSALEEGNDAVIGPATDGGFVLLALTRWQPGLLDNIVWGSGDVIARLRDNLLQSGFRWRELHPLSDIDRPEDLSGFPEFVR